MRLNPDIFAFGVEGGIFLGFILTHRGIEANPEKRRAITEICTPENVREIQRLIERLTTLSRFGLRLVEKTQPIVQFLRKAANFQWTNECEGTFLQLKAFLASLPVIQKSNATKPIIIYLAVLEDVAIAALIQEVEKE